MRIHSIKILPQFFTPVCAGIKSAEVRYDDRGYQSGDVLELKEWSGQAFTGRIVYRLITGVFPLDCLGFEDWVLICMN